MIDFACKKFDLKEVIRCSLALTKTEFKILEYFINNSDQQFTAQEISKKFNIGLSTSQKLINEINKKRLIKRSQKNLEKGGYIFVYSIKEKEIVKERILEIVSNWMQKFELKIEEW
jgi:predicted transcriptional regulator